MFNRIFLTQEEMMEFFILEFGSFSLYRVDIHTDGAAFDLWGSDDALSWVPLLREHPVPPGFVRHLYKYCETLT
ncbi:hypothetical protein JXR74_06640 [Candidatus Mcinerneyibacteriota bacterium]|nr:hypothetical protein [Candidatus Mcinerneyibacteriota bacterium]